MLEKQEFIVREVEKLLEARIICEVIHADWISNPVMVPKHNGEDGSASTSRISTRHVPRTPTRSRESTR